MAFIDSIKKRAKQNKKTIVLPETADMRTLEAAHKILQEGIADIILVGDKQTIIKKADGLDLTGAKFVDPYDCDKLNDYVSILVELRKKKGMTPEEAKELLLTNVLYFGCIMVKAGDADGMVAGAVNSSANVLRAALQILKTAPDTKLVSAFFLVVVPNCEMGEHGTFIFSDAGLNQFPDARELAAIAESSAKSFELLVEAEPIVAMLSHSTKGSAHHPEICGNCAGSSCFQGTGQRRSRKGKRIDLSRSGCWKYWIQACTASRKGRCIWSDYTGYCKAGQRSVQRMFSR